jgi:hypothetical protein
MISTLPMTCLRRIRGSGPDVRVWKPDSGIVARRGDVDRQCRQRKKCTCPRGGLVRSASLLVYSATLRGRSKKCTSIGQHVRVCFAASWLGSPWRGTMHRKGKSAHAHEEVWGDPPRSWSTRPRCEAGPKSARRSATVFALVLRHRGWARASRVRCTVGHRCHRLCACYCIVPTVEMFLTANPPLAPAFHLVQPTLGQILEEWDRPASKMKGKNALEALLVSKPALRLCLPNNNSLMKSMTNIINHLGTMASTIFGNSHLRSTGLNEEARIHLLIRPATPEMMTKIMARWR